MKNVPTLFGYPIWNGKIKRRVVKKYLNRWSIGRVIKYAQKELATLDIGDIVNDCSGYNGIIKELEPFYTKVGKGYIISDIDFTTSNTCCSLIHCGVGPARSQKDIEDYIIAFIAYYAASDFCSAEQIARYNKIQNALLNNHHVTDDNGLLLDEFKC